MVDVESVVFKVNVICGFLNVVGLEGDVMMIDEFFWFVWG